MDHIPGLGLEPLEKTTMDHGGGFFRHPVWKTAGETAGATQNKQQSALICEICGSPALAAKRRQAAARTKQAAAKDARNRAAGPNVIRSQSIEPSRTP
jgi:hypothetical protein